MWPFPLFWGHRVCDERDRSTFIWRNRTLVRSVGAVDCFAGGLRGPTKSDAACHLSLQSQLEIIHADTAALRRFFPDGIGPDTHRRRETNQNAKRLRYHRRRRRDGQTDGRKLARIQVERRADRPTQQGWDSVDNSFSDICSVENMRQWRF